MSKRQTTNRTALSNFLQGSGETNLLTWHDTVTGPAHHPVWTSVAIYKGEERGRASGPTKNDAREAAAGQALQSLRP
ncbi:hypothetical protein JAAARDRAFT_189683 [Jaapia argillacea MUCL 33604]|uniref:DRBM domain-containing protein n=1 Tax=Jaapia argillacea MUCL 33604 TaxID=933084 RepID=A0A067Q5L9_9AGAM|nr:hypothetical protein JAAARDRAFT_189683 [Jaapia argillacea MUCL 33604]